MAIISFFMSPFGRIIGMGIGALMLLGTLAGIYKMHNDSIRREALALYNRNQLEQIIKDQNQFISKMNELSELQKSTLTNLQTQNDTLNRKLGTIDDYLSSKEATAANKTSSDVLKNTVRQLELLK